MTDYNRLKANPDPAMINATKMETPELEATSVVVTTENIEDLNVEVLDKKPVEVEVKVETLSI